jgi:hypothetical protein
MKVQWRNTPFPMRPSFELEKCLFPFLWREHDGYKRISMLGPKRVLEISMLGQMYGFSPIQSDNLRRQLIRSLKSFFFQSDKSDFDPPPAERTPYIFEDMVAHYLKAHAVKFRRENELPRIRGQGTPDFIIDQDLTLNGRHVRWIECKHCYGSTMFGSACGRTWLLQNSSFKHVTEQRLMKHPMAKIEEQVRRYERQFGPGALLFSYGFSKELTFGPNIILLDSTEFVDNGKYS